METQVQPYEQGLSGKTGDVVYYNRFGKTLKRNAPGSYNKIPTAKQAFARARFLAAHRFAQAVIADPALKALYAKKADHKRTAYAMAVSEFMMRY